jgi:hypothetical protein
MTLSRSNGVTANMDRHLAQYLATVGTFIKASLHCWDLKPAAWPRYYFVSLPVCLRRASTLCTMRWVT